MVVELALDSAFFNSKNFQRHPLTHRQSILLPALLGLPKRSEVVRKYFSLRKKLEKRLPEILGNAHCEVIRNH